jgi:rhodanese-related sulfurtransferase
MKITIFLTLIVSIFAVFACRTASSEKTTRQPAEKAAGVPAAAAQSEIKQISVGEARQLTEGKDVQFIDVRTPEEYASGHAPKAAHFPLDSLEKDLAKLNAEKPVYVICETGRRSQKGAEILRKAGFKDIYNTEGGTGAWIKAGFPIEK